MARGLLTWHLVRKGMLPVVVSRDVWSAYVETLKRADAGDLAPAVSLLVGLEKESLLKALGVAQGKVPKAVSD